MADRPSFLPINYLEPNPLQPRGMITSDSLADLVDSVKIHGIIEPLVVAHTPAGYQIIAGERRWRAAKIAGLTEVPVLIKETTPQGMLEMAIVENVQRTDLNPVDRAKSFDRLISEFYLSNLEVSQRIGKSPSYVSNTIKLLDLPDALKDGLISGIISEGHARALSAIKDTASMIEAYKIIMRENGSVRRAEELARRLKKEGVSTRALNKSGFNTDTVDEKIDIMADDIISHFGRNTKVNISRSKRETIIKIHFKGNPKDTEAQVKRLHQALSDKIIQ